MADLLLKDNRLFENLLGVQYDYLAPFFWIHGESEELLVKELDALYDSNIRSVCFESRVHPDFCGDKYWRDMRFLLDECRKRNLRAWILDDVLCPSGTCNNLLKKSEYSDYMPWEIRECHVDIPGPVREGAISLECHFSAETESIIAIVACRRVPDSNILTGDAVELTDCVADGMVYFTLGEGVWRIFMFVKTRQNVLPICDKLRPEATDFYISMVHQPHYDNLSEYFGNTLMGFFNDEPGFHNNHNRMYSTPSGRENAQYPWGECVSEGLAGIYGTDYCKKLCGLWYPFDDKSEEKLRCEYMNLISDAFGKNYTSKISSWCKIHGVELIGHILEDGNAHAKTGYGCGHFFKAMGDMDMSGIDVVLHQIVPGMTRYSNSADSEFRHHDNVFYTYYLAKLGASLGHIDNRKKGRTMCEIFGAYGYCEGTKMMKYIADHMLVRGINYFVPAAFSGLEDAPLDNPPLFYAGGKNPQYSYIRYLMDYMNRSAHMLSGGIHVSSCAILYDAHGQWSNGNFLPGQNVAKVLYDNHYDYDIIPWECVTNIDRDGYLNGEKYNLILVPYSSYIPDNVKDILKNSAVPVVFVCDSGQDTEEFFSVDLRNLTGFMQSHIPPDVLCDYADIYLRSYHYMRGNTHVYMFVNESISDIISTDLILAAYTGGEYAVYDAMDNTAYKAVSHNGKIHIDLPPYSSIMIVCGELDYSKLEYEADKVLVETETLGCNFDISLADSSGTFEHYISTDKLFNVTGPAHKPRFSGKMLYKGKINLKKADSIVLDLGEVGEAVRVNINGNYVGSKPAPPYRFEISQYTSEGENEIEIEVSNHLSYSLRDGLSRFLLYEPSGLLGPINAEYYRVNRS